MATSLGEYIEQIWQEPRLGYEALIPELCDGIFFVDSHGNVAYIDERFAALFHTSSADTENRPFGLLLKKIANCDENSECALESFHAALSSLSTNPRIYIHLLHDGVPRLIELTLFQHPRPENDSEPAAGWGCVARDSTADHNKATQRTRALQNVATDVRSYLVLIKGLVSTLLAETKNNSENGLQEYLRNIDSSTQQSIHYLEYIRDLCALELGEIALEFRPTDPLRLIESVVRQVKAQNTNIDLRLISEPSSQVSPILVDLTRIRRVLHILFENMSKLLPRWKRITVTLDEIDQNVRITTVGEAVGSVESPEEDEFGALQRDHLESLALVCGPDLGWYVIRSLVENHKGHFWVHSLPGQRVESRLLLPKARCPSEELHIEENHISPRIANQVTAERQKPRHHAKVLVIDDDPSIQHLFKITLERAGYDVLHAADGEMALELSYAERPDLILLDVYLPDANGFDICTQLREFTAAPILMVTCSSSERDLIRGLSTGADDYLVKPIRIKELLARVEANLRRLYLSDLPGELQSDSMLHAGDLLINVAKREVSIHGQTVKLTPIEYKLLYHLVANAGRVLTHDQLVSKVWGTMFRQETQYLWVNISRLRSKIEQDPDNPEYILTERGVGYYFSVPVDTALHDF